MILRKEKNMGLIRFVQKYNENVERQRIRELEEQKLAIMRKQEKKQSKQIFCPHCGKSFNIEL